MCDIFDITVLGASPFQGVDVVLPFVLGVRASGGHRLCCAFFEFQSLKALKQKEKTEIKALAAMAA